MKLKIIKDYFPDLYSDSKIVAVKLVDDDAPELARVMKAVDDEAKIAKLEMGKIIATYNDEIGIVVLSLDRGSTAYLLERGLGKRLAAAGFSFIMGVIYFFFLTHFGIISGATAGLFGAAMTGSVYLLLSSIFDSKLKEKYRGVFEFFTGE